MNGCYAFESYGRMVVHEWQMRSSVLRSHGTIFMTQLIQNSNSGCQWKDWNMLSAPRSRHWLSCKWYWYSVSENVARSSCISHHSMCLIRLLLISIQAPSLTACALTIVMWVCWYQCAIASLYFVKYDCMIKRHVRICACWRYKCRSFFSFF